MTGIDISGVQLDDVPGAWEFIVVKLSEGLRTPNPRFAAQWANAKRTTRGVYHYPIVGSTTPQGQANFFADHAIAAGFKPGLDIWQLDAEAGLNGGASPLQWQQFVTGFMDTALSRLGARGFLYAGWYFVLANGLQPHIAKYKWWLPAYGPNDGNVHPYPAGVPADKVVIHQFTSRLNGESLDGNRIVDAVRYGAAAPTPTPAPAPKTHGDEVSFYHVVDAPDKISPKAIFEKAGQFTRLMASPTDLQVNQWLAAVDGTQNVGVINTVPYASHVRFWGAPATVSQAQALGEAPEPAPQVNVTITTTP